MLFDSPGMNELRKRHQNTERYLLPKILAVDMLPELAGEKTVLERLITEASSFKQNQWLPALLSGSDEKFIPAWYEMLLYEWLLAAGSVASEAAEDEPDYTVTTANQTVNIEAKARIVSREERTALRDSIRITKSLEAVPLPFVVVVTGIQLQKGFSETAFQAEVAKWLSGSGLKHYEYKDASGSLVAMKADAVDYLEKVVPMHVTGGRVDITPVRTDFKKKSHQHKQHRHSRNPYLIALYYEDSFLGQEEVLDVMFGLPMVQIDRESGALLKQGRDKSGLLISGNVPIHTTVSGVLVFRQRYDETEARRSLEGYYVENPYAKVPCASGPFPVTASFRIIGRTQDAILMNWDKK